MSMRIRPGFQNGIPKTRRSGIRRAKFVARRNLIWSIVAENIGFSVWLIWSIVATKLPAAGFHYSTDQLFQLVAFPGLIGSLMRFPYTFAVTTFGGRNWTIFSARRCCSSRRCVLAYFVSQPETPFWLMLLVASTAGLGGGNFASSMANISFFYPDRMKGWALGLNAAGGNIGVSSVQLLTPILMGIGLINLYQATPVRRSLSAECRVDVGAADHHRGVRRHLLHEQPDLGEVLVQEPACDRQAQAHLDHGLHLYRDVRLLHRLLRGVSAADQDPVPGNHDRASPSSGRWSARCRARSAACSPTRSAAPS